MTLDGSPAQLPVRRPVGPPPRPPVTRALPPPRRPGAGPLPPLLRAAVVLHALAGAGALAGAVAAVADLSGSRARLTADAMAQDPEATTALVRDGVAVTLTTALSAIGVLVVLGGVCLALVLHRRPWARWALGLVAVAAVPVTLVVGSVVSGGPEVDRYALLAAGPVAVLGALLLLAPSVGAWLHGSARRR